MATLNYLHNDKPITLEEAAKHPVLVAGADKTPDLVRVFESNDEFLKWVEPTPNGPKVRETLGLLKDKVLPQRGNEAWIEKMQRLALARTQANFVEFAKLLNRPMNDEEVARKAMVEKTPLTPTMFDPSFLWDYEIEKEPPTGAPENSHTSTLILPSGWWPNLGWVGWNDRARSARVFGLLALCENSWFNFLGGRWCWLTGFNGLFNLRHFGFDKIASSAIVF